MKLRTYQAYSMAEALAAVKRDLGSNAVILNTRSFHRGGILGIGRRTIIEVTATPAGAAKQTSESKPLRPGAAAARRAYGGDKQPASSVSDSPQVTLDDQQRTRRLAQAMAAKFDRQQASSARENQCENQSTDARAHGDGNEHHAASAAQRVSVDEQRGAVQTAPPVQRFLLTSPDTSGLAEQQSPRRDASGTVDDELTAIKSMVGQVLQRQTRAGGGPSPAMPPKLFDMYLKLIAQDISDELADEIVSRVREDLTSEQFDDESAVRASVMKHLASHIPVAEQDTVAESPDGRPLTIALIGPTGVGKTTTLAKLAATYKLRQQRKVGMITSDTYRIAAVDQLRTYANIIGLPLQVALTPAEMQQAVHALSDCDVILIDTAGRGQNDAARLDELRAFLDAAQPHEVHLVLSSTANEKVLLREAEAFSEVGMNKVVLTKLDEAVSFGMLINVIRQVGTELSFLTTGQEVPTHIEVGKADRLAELILGGEVHA